METVSRSSFCCAMDALCEVCGSVGFKHLLVQCNNCKDSARHRYCMDTIVYDGPLIAWLCDDCLPKHNEFMESLEAFSIQRQQNHIQLDPSITNGSYVDSAEVTKELRSWGRHRYRSRKAKIHASKHFLNGGTFNSKMFTGNLLKQNDAKNKMESTNSHLIDSSKCNDGPNHSTSFPTSDIEEHVDVLKTMGSFEPTMNSMEELDLSKEKDHCFPPKHIEELFPHGTKVNLFPAISDIERDRQCVTDNSCPILPSVEQANGPILAVVSAEQPHPFEVVKPDDSDHLALEPALDSKENIGFENATVSFEPTLNSMEWLDLSKEKDSCISSSNYVVGSIPQGTKTDLFPSVNDVERSRLSTIDGSSPAIPIEEQVDGSGSTLESWKQPYPLEVIPPLVHMPKSIQGSKSPSNYSQPVQGPDLNIGNDPLNPSKVFLDLRSTSKAIEPSCSSNGQGGSTVEKDDPNSTKCTLGKEFIAPALDNCKGSSLSIAKYYLVSNADNSDEVNISDKHVLCNTDNREQEQSMKTSHQNISKGEVHRSGMNERSNLCQINENSNPKSMLMGNKQGSNLQDNVWKTSVHADQNGICKQVSQTEGIKSEALPSETVSPCKETKSRSEKQQNRSKRPSRYLTENPKPKIIKKIRYADPAQFKSAGSSKQLDHTYSSASSKVEKPRSENDAKLRSDNSMQKKRKRLVLQYNKDEGAEALHVEDLNQPFENDGQLKKHRMQVESGVMNQTISVENCTEALRKGTSNSQYANNYSRAKKQKIIKASDDGNALLGDLNDGCAQNDTAAQLASQNVVAGDHCSVSRMPVISAPTDAQCDIPTQPIDEPYWTGIMKIGQEYISLAAHLSNKACKKVQELSRSLPPVMKVTKHPKLKVWPSRWEESEPTAESIALYFFPDNMRPNKDLDRLVQYVTDHSIVLKYAVGFANLLIFSSVFLPEKFQMFQGKHYLWGVFKRRKSRSKGDPPVKKQDCTSQVAKEKKDQVQVDTLDQERPVSKHSIPKDNQPSPGAVNDVDTETKPGDDGKAQSSSEAPTPMVFGVFKAQTPRSGQLIRELKNEGAVVFPSNRSAVGSALTAITINHC